MVKPKRTKTKSPQKEVVSAKGLTGTPSYRDAMSRVEEILQTIEDGEVDVDELSVLVKEAADLVALCRGKIRAAEIQVKTIEEKLEKDAPENAGEDE